MAGTIPLVDLAWPDSFGAIHPNDDEILTAPAPERMHSLATLGIPRTLFGVSVPLSRLEDVVLRDTSGIARDGEYGAGRASTGAWRDIAPVDGTPAWSVPSPDSRSSNLVRALLGEAAYAPSDAQTAVAGEVRQRPERWGGNLPRIVVTPRQYDWATPEGSAENFSNPTDYRRIVANVDPAFGYDTFGAADPAKPVYASGAGAVDYTGLLDLESDLTEYRASPNKSVQLAESLPLSRFTPIPPVFVPGTPENRRWAEQAISGVRGLADAIGRQRPHENECDKIHYDIDIPTCSAISRARGKRAGERCYQSALRRYAACLKGDPLPPLDTWNN